MKNPKLQFDSKWFVMDAPEMPPTPDTFSGMSSKRYSYLLKKLDDYQEALSKAPRWEVKNQEEIKIIMFIQSGNDFNFAERSHFCELWHQQIDPTKLYDLPKSYTYRIEKEECSQRCIELNCGHAINKEKYCCFNKEFAILISEEELKETINLPAFKSTGIKLTKGFADIEDVKETESQEELWSLLFQLTREGKYNLIKSEFIINRRK